MAIGFFASNLNLLTLFNFKNSYASDYEYSNTHKEDSVVEGNIITINNLPKVAVKNKPIKIPKTVLVSNIDNSEINIVETRVKIKSPYGEDFLNEDGSIPEEKLSQIAIDSNLENYILTPNQIGNWSVMYAVKNSLGVWTVSDICEITVIADAYSLKFIENDLIVMPKTINTNIYNTKIG